MDIIIGQIIGGIIALGIIRLLDNMGRPSEPEEKPKRYVHPGWEMLDDDE